MVEISKEIGDRQYKLSNWYNVNYIGLHMEQYPYGYILSGFVIIESEHILHGLKTGRMDIEKVYYELKEVE